MATKMAVKPVFHSSCSLQVCCIRAGQVTWLSLVKPGKQKQVLISQGCFSSDSSSSFTELWFALLGFALPGFL